MADCDAEAAAPLIPCASRLPLTLDAVRAYGADPFWRRVRAAILFALFALWLSMLAVAAVATATAAPCHPLSRAKRSAPGPSSAYHRVEASLCGGGGDSGEGDLRELITKLDYLVELGVKIVWLSSIFKSPNKNIECAVEDFKTMDADFGALEMFKEFVSEMKKRDLKLVIDLVPNHTSEKHVWFQKSIGGIDPYTNYYIWKSPSKYDENGNPIPPNDWVSMTGGSAWEFNEQRNEYYLHQFLKEQPNLNFHNTKVLEEMLDIFRFWLDLGVDGFSLDTIPYLFEDPQLRDEPSISNGDQSMGIMSSHDPLNHNDTHELPETLGISQIFWDYIEDYSNRPDGFYRAIHAVIMEPKEALVLMFEPPKS